MTTVEAASTAPGPAKRDRLRLTPAERRTMRQDWEEKTFKREISLVLIGFWAVITLIATFRFLILYPDAATLTAMGTAFGSLYTIATTMIFVFAGAAFSIDAYAKQIK